MTAPLDHRSGPFSEPATSAVEAVTDRPRDDDRASGPWALLRAHGPAIGAGVGVVVLIAAAVWLFLSGDDTPPTRRVQEFTIVNVTPPPPPPPPPEVRPQPQTEPEMIEQKPIVEPEIKEEAKVEEPKDAPPNPKDEPPAGPLGMDKSAEGPGDSFGLVGRPGGRGLVGGGGGGGGSRWGAFAAIVQQQLEAALHANAKIRKAVMQVQVRVWVDSTGRVTRVQLASSSGDPDLDAAIRDEALVGIMLRSPPPADMPMPMVTRITTRRPS